MDKLVDLIDVELKRISEEGLAGNNLMELDKLADIKENLCKIKSIEEGREEMRYSDYGRRYGNYRENYNDYRGDYRGGYSMQGRDTKYRGSRYIDDIDRNYGNYMNDREEYNRGNYNAKEDKMKSLDSMLHSVKDFMKMLAEDSSSQEEMDMIRQTAREISEI